MYGKMQESGLTAIIPLICTSAIWGQYTMFYILCFLRAHKFTINCGCNHCDILCLLIWQAIFHLSVERNKDVLRQKLRGFIASRCNLHEILKEVL